MILLQADRLEEKVQTMNINIALDPVKDGFYWEQKQTCPKEKHALIIGTNGKYRVIGEQEVTEIWGRLNGYYHMDYMGHKVFLVICNSKKIIRVGEAKFFVGSVLVMKGSKERAEFLTDEEVEYAKMEFTSRLVTLCADGMEFSAYEIG